MTTTDALTGVPTPRYAIGQTVWVARTTMKSEAYPCPDCHGTQTWTATTAAGESIRVVCPRCQGYRFDQLPSLVRQRVTAIVHALTVGSIRIDTAAHEPERRVEYMCRETGIGSGQLYHESAPGGLYATQEEAQAEADRLTAEEQQARDGKPEALVAAAFATMPLKVALPVAYRLDTYKAWDRARDYKEVLNKIYEDDNEALTRDAIDEMCADVLEDRPWRLKHPVDAVLVALKNLVYGDNGVDAYRLSRASDEWTCGYCANTGDFDKGAEDSGRSNVEHDPDCPIERGRQALDALQKDAPHD